MMAVCVVGMGCSRSSRSKRSSRRAEEIERRRQERAGADDAQAVTDAGHKAAVKARPKPKAQANFTDPDSRIMKNSDGAYIQAYNAQAVVDAQHQVITAADVTTNTGGQSHRRTDVALLVVE